MRLVCILFCISFPVLIYSQQNTGSVTGQLQDSLNKQPLGLATVTVFSAVDTAIITYRMSTPQGQFRIPALPANKLLRILISYSGYNVYRYELQLSPGEQKELGKIYMTPVTKDLEEVLVFAERPPVVYRKDTIEFNAVAFRTLPTALVEDLLKKLPGVQVDADGNIRVNDRKVNRLLVDGKDFFGTDPRMATRNLPASIIEKVQVMDDRDEAELNPDRLQTDLGQVINLKLKKSIKKGWFGKAYAGAGTAERYEGGSILNLFKDTFQVSLLGYANNLDRAGFGLNDIRTLGGFDRSGLDDYVINPRGLNVNNISFGGQGEGINTSHGAGINLNNVLKNGLTLNTQYFYGKSRNDINELSNLQQFIGDTVLTTHASRNEQRENTSHRFGIGLKGRFNAHSRWEFKPELVLSDQHNHRNSFSSSSFSNKGLLNEVSNELDLKDHNFSYNHSLTLFQSFKKKGRSFNLSNTISYGGTNSNVYSNALGRFYNNTANRDSVTDQLRKRDLNNLSINLVANYNEPVNKLWSFRVNCSVSLNDTRDTLNTLTYGNGNYTLNNPGLSAHVTRTIWRNSLSPSLNFNNKMMSISLNLGLTDFNIDSHIGKGSPAFDQHYTYLLPGFMLRYKRLSLSAGSSVNLPGINDIQPVPDNTNPLNLQYGNPSLLPTRIQNITLGFVKPIPDRLAYFNTNLGFNRRQNFIVRTRVLRADGIQETRPVNVDGIYTFNHFITYRRQYKFNQQFGFSYGGNLQTSFNRSYLQVNERKTNVKTITVTPTVDAGFNWNDIIEWSGSYSYRSGNTFYSTNSFDDLAIHTSSLSSEIVLRWPKNIVIETQLDERYNSAAAPGLKKKALLWNAAINYLFLNDQKGQLKLSVYDLLQQNSNIMRTVTENYIQDRQINMLTRYLLLTFTYNIRDFKGGKVGGRQKFFFF